MRTSRRELLGGLAAGAAALGLPRASRRQEPEAAPRRPNLLFVMADELPWDVLGFAGHPQVSTPHLDALAAGGTRCTRAYTVAPICAPARRSVFTGRYAHVHGVEHNVALPHDGEVHLTTVLRHAGWATALSGKMHFSPVEPDYDFERFWSYAREGPGRDPRYPDWLAERHEGARPNDAVAGSCPFPDDPLGSDIGRFPWPAEEFATHWIADRALEFLRGRGDDERPWFLFLSLRVPHTPYRSPEPYFSMYDPAALDVPAIPESVARLRPTLPRFERRHFVDSEALLRALTAQFLGHVTNADAQIGRVLDELERLDLARDTWVVFTSDHGNMLGERGLYLKGVMYERATHVPLVVRAPGSSPLSATLNAGTAFDGLVENVDLFPTFLDMLGLPSPPAGLQGRSLLPALAGGAAKERAFAERGARMVVTPRHKLVENAGAPAFELYDLIEDPRETRDLAATPDGAELVAALTDELRAWRAERPAPPRFAGLPTPEWAVLPAAVRAAYDERKLARWRSQDER